VGDHDTSPAKVRRHPGSVTVKWLAQKDVYYGYWVYDPVADYYYWFTADVVIVDASWVDYVP
jgi:hypothetical protein